MVSKLKKEKRNNRIPAEFTDGQIAAIDCLIPVFGKSRPAVLRLIATIWLHQNGYLKCQT